MPKFTTHRDSLYDVVSRAVSIVPSSGQSVSAQNFLVSVDNDSVKLTSTDEKVGFRILSKATASEKFDFQVPAKKFYSIVRNMYLGEVQFEVSSQQVKIVSGTASWDLHLMSGIPFPRIPKVKGKATKVDRKILLSAIQSISSAVARDVTRPYLRMISIRDHKATACDGVRFQQVPIYTDLEFQIPLHAMPHLVKLLSSLTEDEIDVRCGEDAVSFESVDGSVSFISRNLSSRFPDVEQMMLRPALENKTLLTVSRTELLHALDRVKLTEDIDTSAIGLKLNATCVTVAARDRSLNASYDTIPATWKGKDRTLVVNSTHLRELLKSFSDEVCNFYLGEDTRTRKSLVLLKSETGAVGLLPQLSTNLVVF